MEFKIRLNGVNIDPLPNGFEDFSFNLVRDPDVNSLLTSVSSSFTFIREGYVTLRRFSILGLWCNRIDVEIDLIERGKNIDTLLGYIYVSDITFNLERQQAEVNVVDRSHASYITQNKRIKAFLLTGKSKNGEDVTPASSIFISFFDTTTNAGGNRRCISLFESFNFLLQFMSDGVINLRSTLMGTGGSFEDVYITTGRIIRENIEVGIYTSFFELYDDLNKQVPLGMWIEEDGTGVYLRIEQRDYFYNKSKSIFTATNIDELTKSFEQQLIYSKVTFGSQDTKADGDTAYTNYPTLQFATWLIEEYHVQGLCNIDNELDLTTKYITDSNVIGFIFRDGTTGSTDKSFDKKLFFIETDGALNATKYKLDPATTESYYNKMFQNDAVAARYERYIPNNIAIYAGSGVDNSFVAQSGTAQNYTTPVLITTFPFDTTVFDPSGNYNNALYRYVVPNNNVYSFEINGVISNVVFNGNAPGALNVEWTFRWFTSGGVLKGSANFTDRIETALDSPFDFIHASPVEYLDATDYVDVTISAFSDNATGPRNHDFSILVNSEFKSLIAGVSSGVVRQYSELDYRIYRNEFEYPMTYDQWKEIDANKDGRMSISSRISSGKAFIQEINYNLTKAKAQIITIASAVEMEMSIKELNN